MHFPVGTHTSQAAVLPLSVERERFSELASPARFLPGGCPRVSNWATESVLGVDVLLLLGQQATGPFPVLFVFHIRPTMTTRRPSIAEYGRDGQGFWGRNIISIRVRTGSTRWLNENHPVAGNGGAL